MMTSVLKTVNHHFVTYRYLIARFLAGYCHWIAVPPGNMHARSGILVGVAACIRIDNLVLLFPEEIGVNNGIGPARNQENQ